MIFQTTTLRLPIIPEPPEGTAAVLVATPDFSGPFISGDGPINLACGKCFRLLGKRLHPGQIQNIVLKCPKCLLFNAVVTIPTLEAIAEKLQSNPQLVASIPSFTNLIQQSQEIVSSPKDLIGQIEQQVPDFGWLKELLIPKTAGDFYGFLGFLMAFLAWYQTRKNKSEKDNPQTLINNYFQSQDPFKNIGRNESCPCGSGRKYKFCHQRENFT